MPHGRTLLDSFVTKFAEIRREPEQAIAQPDAEQLRQSLDGDVNSVAIIMKHVGGNLASRFTVGNVVATEYDEADVYQRRHGTTAGTYPDLDQFGRVIKSRWTKDLTTDMDFVSVDVSYNENSNPLTTEDNIYAAGFDVKYAIDGLDRVTDADEGTLVSGNIDNATRQRRQQGTLTQTGNWDAETLDLNGATAGYGTDGRTETRTHNLVNELTARSVTTDGGGPTAKTLAYDAAGNMTDDGETYAYEYDAWHRLRKIKDRGTSAVLSEHQYYGNGFRSGERYDANDDAVIDGTDPWYWFGYDERWRIVATFVGSDTSPKERFLHHTAGAGGYGGSSYIDQVVLRERDANTAWHLSSDGGLEERLYYCQNWRHDVVALVTATGELRERVRYSSYGIPIGQPLGDCDGDGDVDAADTAILLGAWGTNTPKCDLDLNGTIDATDQSMLLGNSGATSGFGELTRNRNRLGYAGYAADSESAGRWHVRHRTLESELGRWTRRDPAGQVDGASLYGYSADRPIRSNDPTGLRSAPAVAGPRAPDGLESCNATLQYYLLDSEIQHYLRLAQSVCGSLMEIKCCHPDCEGLPSRCCGRSTNGEAYTVGKPDVCICVDETGSPRSGWGGVKQTLKEELIHKWQTCTMVRDLLGIGQDPEYRNAWCKEIGAKCGKGEYSDPPIPPNTIGSNCEIFCTGYSDVPGTPGHGLPRDDAFAKCTAFCAANWSKCCAFHPPAWDSDPAWPYPHWNVPGEICSVPGGYPCRVTLSQFTP